MERRSWWDTLVKKRSWSWVNLKVLNDPVVELICAESGLHQPENLLQAEITYRGRDGKVRDGKAI